MLRKEFTVQKEGSLPAEKIERKGLKGFLGRHGAQIVLAAMVFYVILLMTGTIAEIFHVDSVLDWWIWRPAGK